MWPSLLHGMNFLVETLFTLFLFILMMRVLLPAVNADYYNPFTQFILKITNPLIAPLHRILPRKNRLDIAAIILLILFAYLKNWLILAIMAHTSVNAVGLLLLSIAQILELILQFYFFSIIIQTIISWIQPNQLNPFIVILYQLNAPLLRVAHKMIPPLGGIDFSPLLVILGIQLINIVILNPLIFYAMQLTVGIIR